MGYIIFGACVAFFGVILLVVGIVIKKGNRKFHQNSIQTEGVIVGYYTRPNSSWKTPQVSFKNSEGEGIISRCESAKINPINYPAGTKVKLLYAKTKFWGDDYYETRIINEDIKPVEQNFVGNVISLMGAFLLIVGVVLNIMGLI